jgi:uncharacterized protein DUF6519
MAQDLSRSAFDVHKPKHWSSVQAQQGRLLTDDDFNEADEITKEDIRRTRADVVGASGSPDDGFMITNPRVTGFQIDFDLSPGTIYVGGLRVTLEATEAFSLQKDWLQQAATDRPALTKRERIDQVYLEVWQQPVTSTEDGELREVALGGPDTSVRLRTMRRVHVLPDVGSESCSAGWAKVTASVGLGPDNERTNDATLRVGYLPNTAPAANLCSPSVQSGYLGAENQAIRVEVGSGGNTLLWGFDNASPLYRVTVTTDVAGAQVIHFLQPPKDEASWPLAEQVVELLPWSAVLPNGEKVAETNGGFLAKVSAAYDPNAQTIKVLPVVPATFGTTWQSRSDAASIGTASTSFFYLRAWNRGADIASQPEIPFTPGTPVELKNTGITVTVTGTTMRPGDFWIIAARPESPAKVVPWALESGQLAKGIRRFYAPLGLIHWRPLGIQTAYDCRNTFAPLIDPRGCCVTLTPGSSWQHTVDELAGEDDICLCFSPGDYTTTKTIVLSNKHVQVHGTGPGSRLRGIGLENVLQFNGCASVELTDLSVTADTASPPGGTSKPHLSGAVTAVNCDHVTIAGVLAQSASAPNKSASCIAAYTEFAGQRASLCAIRVDGCDLVVGANQVGLSVVNYGRSTITDNSVHVDLRANAAIPQAWLRDKLFRRVFRRTLLWRYGVITAATPAPPGAITLNTGDNLFWIEAPGELRKAWLDIVKWRKFPKGFNYRVLGEFLNELAEDLIYGMGAIGKHGSPAVKNYLATILGARTALTKVRMLAAQGIVVAGTTADEVRIKGNTVRDSVQGIHVGVSAQRVRNPGGGVSDTAGRVVIDDNVVAIALMAESSVERHGVFVGNVRSLIIQNNQLSCERVGAASRMTIDGIRVYGFIGPMGFVTRNDLSGFTTGIRFAALNNIADGQRSMWRVVDNIAVGAGAAVDPSLKVGSTTHLLDPGNMT